jgi:hypothetical protein
MEGHPRPRRWFQWSLSQGFLWMTFFAGLLAVGRMIWLDPLRMHFLVVLGGTLILFAFFILPVALTLLVDRLPAPARLRVIVADGVLLGLLALGGALAYFATDFRVAGSTGAILFMLLVWQFHFVLYFHWRGNVLSKHAGEPSER